MGPLRAIFLFETIVGGAGKWARFWASRGALLGLAKFKKMQLGFLVLLSLAINFPIDLLLETYSNKN